MTQATEIKTPEPVKAPTNIDDLISGYKVPEVTEVKQSTSDDDADDQPTETSTLNKEQDHGEETNEKVGKERNANEEEKEVKDSGGSKDSSEFDEYGNEIAKERLYTRDELNQIIRDRLKRGEHSQQHSNIQQQATNQQVQQAAEGFTQDPNSNDSWEVQLDRYIDKRLEARENKAKNEEWQVKEHAKQMEFQEKFSSGMERYKDFREVAGKTPITDSMLLATRDMKDPAAFIYAASKMHPEEVKRIASLPDPYQQAAEIGRLEERMRKSRNVTQAAAPLKQTGASDVSAKSQPKQSIDHLINSHAKRKSVRR